MHAISDHDLWHRLGAGWLPNLRRTVVPGERLARAGEALDTVYFPFEAIVLVARHTPFDPLPLTVTLIGPEGLVGWQALLFAPTWSHDAIAINAGAVIGVPADSLRSACAADPALNRTLLAVANFHSLQLAQNVVANLGHSVERRLARWLTMLDDRTAGDVLNVKHDQLAQLLNVRRATITDALHVLEGERLVRNSRGRLQVRDRAGLEARAGQSYGFCESEYVRAIGPFGKGLPSEQAQHDPAG